VAFRFAILEQFMRVLDLSLPLDSTTPVFKDRGGYQDPNFQAERWAVYSDQGFSVHRVELGTHTGTHLDAPAHFHPGGRTVDQLLPEDLVGQAVVIDVRLLPRLRSTHLKRYADAVQDGSLPLFLAPKVGLLLSTDAVATIADWRPRLILYSGQFLDEASLYHHNRSWLGADIPMVTDLNPQAAAQVRDKDLLVVAPLPLVGMDGAPCRVFALQQDTN
jgi:kynurenine formamidase